MRLRRCTQRTCPHQAQPFLPMQPTHQRHLTFPAPPRCAECVFPCLALEWKTLLFAYFGFCFPFLLCLDGDNSASFWPPSSFFFSVIWYLYFFFPPCDIVWRHGRLALTRALPKRRNINKRQEKSTKIVYILCSSVC